MFESNSSIYAQIGNEETTKKAAGYKNSLLDKLNEQRLNNSSLCDMTISADETTFYVHKCLMIASCDYFAAMQRFDKICGALETRHDKIELKGISSQGLKEVIDFIYTGELRLNLSKINDILRAVSHLQVKYALKLCEEYLIEETTVDNCIDMNNLAELFCINKVKEEINRYILRNFEKLYLNEQFKRLSLEQMQQVAKSNKLRLYPEIRVFNCCVDWLRNYIENGDGSNTQNENCSAVYSLMQYVRFNTMKPEEFINIVTKNDLIKGDSACNELLIEAYEYFALPNRQYCSSSPRSQIRNELVMVCVNECMYILNKREENWQYLCHSQATCKTLSQKFAVVNNFLYACGGYAEIYRETTNKCHRFDPRTSQWYSVASMNEKRQFFSLASCDDCIVAVGGVYGNVGNFYATYPVQSPVEVYSIEKDSWESLKDCNLPPLKWPGVCVFNSKEEPKKKLIFIVGGKICDIGPHHSLSDKSFILDLSTNNVEVCAPPITTRFNPSVFYDPDVNKIILFGGEDDKYRLAPVIEMFDLKTRQWSEVATIPVSLSYQCISSTNMINSKIYYVIEEHDGPTCESYILKSANFDIKTCEFEVPQQLPHPSTLASKWCSLTFPAEFLEKCQALTSTDLIEKSYSQCHISTNKSSNICPRNTDSNNQFRSNVSIQFNSNPYQPTHRQSASSYLNENYSKQQLNQSRSLAYGQNFLDIKLRDERYNQSRLVSSNPSSPSTSTYNLQGSVLSKKIRDDSDSSLLDVGDYGAVNITNSKSQSVLNTNVDELSQEAAYSNQREMHKNANENIIESDEDTNDEKLNYDKID